MADETGWMDGAARIPTTAWGYSNFPEDGMYPQAIVCHVAQGYFSGLTNIARANEPGKSWHFSVGRNGEIAQHVSIWNPAYHAGIVADPQPAAGALLARFGQNPNTWSVGIEQEGFSVDPGHGYDHLYGAGHPWPEAQVEAMIRITKWVWSMCQWLQQLPADEIPGRILTHSTIDQRTRRQDPGDFWLATVRPKILAAMQAPEATPPASTGGADVPAALELLRTAMTATAGAIVKLGG